MAVASVILCCNARDLSPDAPNARTPMLPRHARARPHNPRVSSSTPSDNTPSDIELSDFFARPSASSASSTGANTAHNGSGIHVLRKKLSRASAMLRSSPSKTLAKARSFSMLRKKSSSTIKTTFDASFHYDADARRIGSDDFMLQLRQAVDDSIAENEVSILQSIAEPTDPEHSLMSIDTPSDTLVASSNDVEDDGVRHAMGSEYSGYSPDYPASFSSQTSARSVLNQYQHGKLPFEQSATDLTRLEGHRSSLASLDQILALASTQNSPLDSSLVQSLSFAQESDAPGEDSISDGSPQSPEQAPLLLRNMRISQHLKSLSSISSDDELERVLLWDIENEPVPPINPSVYTANYNVVYPKQPQVSDLNENSDASRPRLVFKERSNHLNHAVDGPSEAESEPIDPGLRVPARSSTSSMGANYDATAEIWQKAMSNYAEGQRTGPPKPRGSLVVFQSLNRTRPSRQSFPEDEAIVNLKIDTRHSFDRLDVPSRQSISRSQSITGMDTNLAVPAAEPDVPTLFIPITEQHVEQDRLLPSITLTEHSPLTSNPTKTLFKHDTRPPSSRPWAGYPSHDRELRNGPAGYLDGVIVRDFQPPITVQVTSSPKKKKLTRLRAKTIRLKLRLFTELPSAFKDSNASFRRREHGHRSSIAPGGALEYPELELLPAAEQPRPIQPDLMTFAKAQDHRVVVTEDRLEEALAPAPLSAEGWARHYSRVMEHERPKRKSESVSPLDGSLTVGPYTPWTPQLIGKESQSQPTRILTADTAASRELRASTNDLCERLDADWRKSLARLARQTSDPSSGAASP